MNFENTPELFEDWWQVVYMGYNVIDPFTVDRSHKIKCLAAYGTFKDCTAFRNHYKEEKAHNAITYIIARYLRVKDFAITESFTGYLFLRIKHELFYQRKVDKIVDFVDWESYRGTK